MDTLDSKSIDDDDLLIAPNDLEKSTVGTISRRNSSQSSGSESASDRRDEVQEIRNRSRHEDRRIQLWRSVLLFLIVVVGIAVAGVTFYVLREEEKNAMNVAVSTC